MENKNQLKGFFSGRCFSGFGIAGGDLAGVELSGRGFNPRPAQAGIQPPTGSRKNAKMGGEELESGYEKISLHFSPATGRGFA